MTTLTRIAYYTRKGIVWGGIGVISFLVLKTLIGVGIKEWKKAHPVPTQAPNVRFGKLPKIKFPPLKLPYPKEFVLETITGELPKASSSAKVYQIPKKLPRLLAARRAQEFANRLGFTQKPFSKTPTKYKFKDPNTSLRTLDLDIVTYNFSLKYDFLKDPEVFKEKNLPPPEKAKSEALSFFQATGNFPLALQNGERKVSLLRFSKGKLIPATSLSKAEAIRVDFLRERVENQPVLPPEFDKSSVFIIFSGASKQEKRVLLAQFIFFEINDQTTATYPLKTPQQAWKELNQGKGFIARWEKKGEKIAIRKVYLAYYDSPSYQPFLQPIFVFEGDQKFVAYISAIKDEWVE